MRFINQLITGGHHPAVNEQFDRSTLSDTRRAWKISFHSTLVRKSAIFSGSMWIYQRNVVHTIGHVINFIRPSIRPQMASTKKWFTTRREFQDGTTKPKSRKWWFPRLGEPTLKELMSGQWDLYPEMKVTMEPKQWFVLLLYVEWLQHWSW